MIKNRDGDILNELNQVDSGKMGGECQRDAKCSEWRGQKSQ